MTPVWVLPAVIGISFLISLCSQLVNFKLTDANYMKTKRKEMMDLQKKINPSSTKQEIDAAQTKLLEINNELMKHTMKPTLYTFIPLLVAYYAMGYFFKPFGDLISFGSINVPLFGTGISWLGTYILSSFIFSLLLRPLLTKISENKGKKKQEDELINA